MDVTAYRNRPENKPVTLYDICKKTGLSTATVSRVLNNSPNVRPTTRDRILRVAAELGYVPSPHARALAGHKTESLGVIFPRIASGFFAEVLEGIDEVTAERGYHLTAAFSRHRRAEEELVQQFVRERRVDALVLMNLLLPDEFVLDAAKVGIPIVLIDRPVQGQGLVNITLDNLHGAKVGLEHLWSLGYRKVAVIKGPAGSYDAQQRFEGVEATAGELGLELDPEFMWEGNFTEASGRVLMRDWMDQARPLPDAIFALNDAMAFGVIDALRERGMHSPEDLAVIGFDDVDSARHLQLTTVRCPMREMGRVAADAAIRVLTGTGEVRDRMLETELVVRQTCGSRMGVRPKQTNDPMESLDMNTMQRLGLSVLVSVPMAAGLAAGQEEAQLLANPGFETPDLATQAAGGKYPTDWVLFSKTPEDVRIEVTDQAKHSGNQSCRVRTHVKADHFQGLFQALPVEGGATYGLSVWALNDAASPLRGSAHGQISIEWKDDNDEEIERIWGPKWGPELSTSKWKLFEMSAIAPRGAVKAHFVVTQLDGDEPGGGSFLLDDAAASRIR